MTGSHSNGSGGSGDPDCKHFVFGSIRPSDRGARRCGHASLITCQVALQCESIKNQEKMDFTIGLIPKPELSYFQYLYT